MVERVLLGEKDLFEIIMRRYNQRLYRLARAIVKSDDEAVDVMQQSYVSAYCRLYQFAGAAKFSTWLTRIAFHEALRRARNKLQPLNSTEELFDPRVDPEREAVSAELRVALERAIEILSVEQRAVFLLRCVENLSTEETAVSLDLPLDRVRVALYRARGSLRRFFEHQAGSVSDVFRLWRPVCDVVVARVLSDVPQRAA